MPNFSEILKQLRKNQKITQAELSNFLGISKSTLVKYERGERMPGLETLRKISMYFNVSTDFLLSDQNVFSEKHVYTPEEQYDIIERKHIKGEKYSDIIEDYNKQYKEQHPSLTDDEIEILRSGQRQRLRDSEWRVQCETEKSMLSEEELRRLHMIDTRSIIKDIDTIYKNLKDLAVLEMYLALKCDIIKFASLRNVNHFSAHDYIVKAVKETDDARRIEFEKLYAKYMPSALYGFLHMYADVISEMTHQERTEMYADLYRFQNE